MSTSQPHRTLQPGDVAPNVVLDAITRQGKVAVDDYRGRTPVLVGIFRGLHCPYCRRHIAAMAQLEPALREKGIDMLAVVNTPIERAPLFPLSPDAECVGRGRPRACVAPRLRPA